MLLPHATKRSQQAIRNITTQKLLHAYTTNVIWNNTKVITLLIYIIMWFEITQKLLQT